MFCISKIYSLYSKLFFYGIFITVLWNNQFLLAISPILFSFSAINLKVDSYLRLGLDCKSNFAQHLLLEFMESRHVICLYAC